ncbi:MAG: tetratricopeptide repeat protein [Gemmatimonadetes bacterium]|nr:tetratricopeptide repeat protein [Gemmatimonadota bacterium]
MQLSRGRAWILVTLGVVSLFTSAPESRGSDRWLELRSPHFVVVSNAGEEKARGVSWELERTRAVIGRLLGDAAIDTRRPIVVLAVKDEDGLRELIPQFWEEKGRRPAAAYWPGSHEHHVVLRVDTPPDARARAVFHEYGHLLTRLNIPDAPGWLDEGLSELWATAIVEDAAVEIGRPALHHLKVLRGRRAWIPLGELLAMRRAPDGRDSKRLSLFYAQSWALTHCLMLGRCLEQAGEAPWNLQLAPPRYLEHLRQGADPVEAGRLAFGDLSALDETLWEYLQAGRFRALRFEVDPVAEPGPAEAGPNVLKALSPAEALAIRAGVLLDGERPAAALPLLTEAVALDPKAAPALETLGRFHFQQNNPIEAARWFDRAIGSGSPSYVAHYYTAILTRTVMGASLSARREAGGERREARDSEEQHLRLAIALNPTFAPAYARLGSLIAESGEGRSTPGERREARGGREAGGERLVEAVELARRAAELEPDNTSYRELLAELARQAGGR